MRKALIVTSVASMVDQFLVPSIQLLQRMEFEVHVACNYKKGNTCNAERIAQMIQRLTLLNVVTHQVDFARNPFRVIENARAYRQVKHIVAANRYELVHCHSPIGGLIARLVCRRLRKRGTKVLYTVHGFHFYQGAPWQNWLLYYPMEKLCAHFTDILITINREDYALAKKKMHAKRVEYVPGIGIDCQSMSDKQGDRAAKRRELGIPEDGILLLSVGELNRNKNHETVIRAISDMDVYYVIAGQGMFQDYLQNLIDSLSDGNRVKLLGFRTDIEKYYAAADIFVFPSFREGLSLSVMEAMASGLPCVVSNIRGNVDLIDEGWGGYLCDPTDAEGFACAINELVRSPENRSRMGRYNTERIGQFDISVIEEKMTEIFSDVCDRRENKR